MSETTQKPSGLAGVEVKLEERISGFDTQLAEYQKRHSELESSYSKMQDYTREVQQAKPTPPPSLSDWGGLAAAAAIFAASASSRRPLVAGLTAGAAALEAQRTNNQEGYAAALEGWYKNMNFALKQEELAGKTMEGILRAQNTTTQQQIAALRALGTNENMQRRIATGDMRVIAQGLEQQQKATLKLGQLQNTMRMQGRTFLEGLIKSGQLPQEQYAAAYDSLEAAINQLDMGDPIRTPYVDWYKSIVAGGAVPGVRTSAATATAEAQNTLARSVNDWYSSADSKKSGAKWKHPNTGVEYTRKQVQQAKESMPSTLPTDLADLARAMGSRAVAAPAAPVAQQLPRAQAEGGPARPKTQEEYNALPKGATFIDPEDGKTYRKP
jgi:hypothetical protein